MPAKKKENEKKLLDLLSNILKVPAKKINDNSSPESIASWDSFNSLLIASEIEKAFGLNFSIEEVITVKSVGDLKSNLRKHKVEI